MQVSSVHKKIIRSVPKRIATAVLFASLCALSLFGQITGDLQVTVADATGAGIPNAQVFVKSAETSTARTVSTDSSGSVRINQLAIGAYEIEVSAYLHVDSTLTGSR